VKEPRNGLRGFQSPAATQQAGSGKAEMSTPRLEIELGKLAHNVKQLVALYGAKGIRLTAVTKAVCGSPQVARIFLDNGIQSLGDSYIANIQRMRASGLEAQYILLRAPTVSDIPRVVDFADISLNTEPAVIRLLGEQAVKCRKVHQVILMVELGDLREGALPSEVHGIVQGILNMPGIRLAGLGTNLACFGGVKPAEQNMRELSAIAAEIQAAYNLNLEFVSGGNSANYQWFISSADVGLVNHLRIGEGLLLGNDTTTHERIPGLYSDAFTLVAEVIEYKTKPSKPHGEIGHDAFGHTPVFQDTGTMRRAILSIGRQDVDVSAVRPRINAQILGASSDHLILDARDAALGVGTEVRFDIVYGALLRAMTSPYVEKVYLG
jgi:predicted amino acid racemase